MNNNISALLTKAYEIEGLLLVASRHGQETPPMVYRRIQQAVQELNQQCLKLDCGDDNATVEQVVAPVAPTMATMPVVEPEPEPVVEPETVVEPEPVIEPVVVPEATDEDNDRCDEDAAPLPFEFNIDKPHDEPTNATQDIEPQHEPIVTAPRDPAKDLRKSLSLNDYYRFRRELFQGNEMAMNNALDLIQEMHSMKQVEDYFIDELEWDRESDDVQYFMEIVSNHFA